MLLAAFTWGDLWRLALAIFLIGAGVGLAYTLLMLGATLRRLAALIRGTQDELLPVVGKLGGTVDRVNAQLQKLEQVTDSAVDAAEAVDGTVRALSRVVTTPVRKLSGLAAGLTYGASSLRTNRSWDDAVRAGKDAASRRERELDDELRLRAREDRPEAGR
jgi:ABC-type transporter Mla subunit MlaD